MRSINILCIILHILLLILHTTGQQQYPNVACPDIFRYAYDEGLGGHVGLIRVHKDGSPTSELQVNMTMNTRTPVTKNIKIVVLTKQEEILYGDTINYAVKFPMQNIIPKVTLIQFNNKILCRDQPDDFEAGVIQTSMWAKSVVTTYSGSSDGQRGDIFSISPTPTQNKSPQFSLTFGAPPNFDPSPFEIPNNLPNNPFIPRPSQNGNRDRVEPSPITPIFQPPAPTPKIAPPKLDTSPPRIPPVRPTISSTPKPSIEATTTRAFKCGTTKSSQNLILGGEGILPGEFPWLAAIMHRQNKQYKLHCTGNLISDKHVLTAGHCVRYHNAQLFDDDDLTIILGKLYMENWDIGGTVRTVKSIEVHPNYKQDHADYDIAMIFLNKAVQFLPTVRPICLWEKEESLDDIIGTYGTVVGWNKDGDGELELSAQKVEMPIVAQDTCLRSNKVFLKYTSSRTFCAGTRDSTTGPCTGDSGAGFMIQDELNRQWYLRGLVGFSLKDPKTLTCDLSNYVIFIDVAKIRIWIEEQMDKN